MNPSTSPGRPRAADYKFTQYHGQAATGTLHENLAAMWEAIRAETDGRVEATGERADGLFLTPPTYFISPQELSEFQRRIIDAFGPTAGV